VPQARDRHIDTSKTERGTIGPDCLEFEARHDQRQIDLQVFRIGSPGRRAALHDALGQVRFAGQVEGLPRAGELQGTVLAGLLRCEQVLRVGREKYVAVLGGEGHSRTVRVSGALDGLLPFVEHPLGPGLVRPRAIDREPFGLLDEPQVGLDEAIFRACRATSTFCSFAAP
jgi:hypothetical protein